MFGYLILIGIAFTLLFLRFLICFDLELYRDRVEPRYLHLECSQKCFTVRYIFNALSVFAIVMFNTITRVLYITSNT